MDLRIFNVNFRIFCLQIHFEGISDPETIVKHEGEYLFTKATICIDPSWKTGVCFRHGEVVSGAFSVHNFGSKNDNTKP